MAVKDIKLDAKARLKLAASSVGKSLKSTVTLGLSNSSPKASQAAKQSNIAARATTDKTFMYQDVLSKIDQAASSGEYFVFVQVLPANLKSVVNYLKSKKYILYSMTSSKGIYLFIGWMGGKAWKNSRIGNKATIQQVGAEVDKAVNTEIERFITNNKLTGINKSEWYAPKLPTTGTIGDTRRSEAFGKLVKSLP